MNTNGLERIIILMSGTFGGMIFFKYAPKKNAPKNLLLDIAYFSLGAITINIPIIYLLENEYRFVSGCISILLAHFALE